jgi:hypothetical protein
VETKQLHNTLIVFVVVINGNIKKMIFNLNDKSYR